MGIFTDFYVADESEVRAAFSWLASGPAGDAPEYDENDPEASTAAINEWLEEQPIREPSDEASARMGALEQLNYKGVMSGAVSTLRHLLLGTEIEISTDFLYSSMQQTVERVPDDLIEALATRPEAELLALAPAWAAHEEVRWSEEHARELFPRLAKLAKAARQSNKGVYLSTSGF